MHYDFETMLNRWGTGSTKWEEMSNYGISPEQSIIPMSNAEMEFYNPPEVIEGLKEYLDTAVLAYYKPTQSYFDSVALWMRERFGWKIEDDWICPYPGIHGALSNLVKAFTQQGDGVIVMEPTWPGFFTVLKENKRICVNNPLLMNEETLSYSIDFEDLERKAADPKNKMIFFCSPHNPIGRVWSRDELERVAEICIAHNVIIVSDEAHADIVMPGFTHIPMASLSKEVSMQTITCTAPSKTFNLAGLCCSNLIIENSEFREAFIEQRVKDGIFRPSMLSLKACELAYSKSSGWLEECLRVLDDNQKYVRNFLAEKIPLIHATNLEGTYLMWLDMRALGLTCEELEKALMSDAKVFFDDGYYFGECGKGFERVNIACPKAAVVDAMDRLHAWVANLV